MQLAKSELIFLIRARVSGRGGMDPSDLFCNHASNGI